ncbi:MAG: tRNA (adenosine(37)-N6)-threonylcarbamoyltransferase complex dimerization subunit type 1 TsaB [Filifactoraceae bacterium]
MLILGIDTSSSFLGVALKDSSGFECNIYENKGMTHSEKLLPGIKDLFIKTGKRIEQLDKVVVTIGPGSFTGIRIGVSTANALVQALNIPICGISTLEAMAYSLSGYDGLIVSTMDAQKGDFYTLFCEFKSEKLVKLKAESVSSKDEILEFAKSYGKTIILGDAIASWEDMPKNFEKSEIYSPDPLILCALGMDISCVSDFVEPVYIKKSQAEVEYEQRNRL